MTCSTPPSADPPTSRWATSWTSGSCSTARWTGRLAAPRLHGLLVSPRTGTSFLGYERTGVRSPALLARWLRWRHRGTFLVHWSDVEAVAPGAVRLREGYRRFSPDLPGRPSQRPDLHRAT